MSSRSLKLLLNLISCFSSDHTLKEGKLPSTLKNSILKQERLASLYSVFKNFVILSSLIKGEVDYVIKDVIDFVQDPEHIIHHQKDRAEQRPRTRYTSSEGLGRIVDTLSVY
jgi:hypothetical protein